MKDRGRLCAREYDSVAVERDLEREEMDWDGTSRPSWTQLVCLL